MFLPLIFFALILFLYIIGVSPSVYGGDSGDIILASWFGGVAHPPGYPLNVILGWIFTHLPIGGTVAYRANLLAAFFQAANFLLMFFILKKMTRNYVASLLGALILAFNPLYLLYAHIIEVFQLNILLLGMATLFLLSWKDEYLSSKGKGNKFLYLFFLSWGFSVFHHHTAILLGPAFLFFIYKVGNKSLFKNFLLVKAGFFFLIGIIPYVFVPFAAMRETPINWNNPQTLGNFIRLMIRADYGTFTAANFLVGSTPLQKFLQLFQYFLFVKADFSLIGLIIITFGITYTFFKERLYFGFTLLAVLISGPFFLVYAGFPISNDFYTGLWERFILVSYFFLTIFLGFGFKFTLEKIIPFVIRKIKIIEKQKELVKLTLSLSLLLIPFALLLINAPKSDLSKFRLGDWLGHDILLSAEPNSLMFVVGDTALFNTQYIYYTSNLYKDRKLIKAGSLAFIEYREQVSREYPELTFRNAFFDKETKGGSVFVQMLVEDNIDKYPVYIRDFEPEVPGFKWINIGLVKKFTKEGEISASQAKLLNEAVFKKLNYSDQSKKLGYDQYITSHLKEHYYGAYMELAHMFLEYGDKQTALFYADRAKELFGNKKDAYILAGNIFGTEKNCAGALDNFRQLTEIDPKDWRAYEALSSLYKECYRDMVKAEEYRITSENLRPKGKFDLKEF